MENTNICILKNNKFFSILMIIAFFSLSFFINSCKEEEDPIPVNETGTVIDVEGNVYKTVKIGNQWWMAENLRVNSFRDGSSISMNSDNAVWETGTSAYCFYENLPSIAGVLYNWNAVSSSAGLAPDGWRIPTDDDWKQLERSLGMASGEADKTGWHGTNEGEKLKLPSPNGWEVYEDIWSTNESGFSAEASSCRLFDGTFGFPGLNFQGFWWTSTESDSENAWYRHLYYQEKGVFRYYGSKNYGFSVRCIKE